MLQLLGVSLGVNLAGWAAASYLKTERFYDLVTLEDDHDCGAENNTDPDTQSPEGTMNLLPINCIQFSRPPVFPSLGLAHLFFF